MISVNDFLLCKTPDAWVQKALTQVPTLLIDHAHCEKKAASAALHLIYKYGQYENLVMQLSRLAREELLHFEMVLKLLKKFNIRFISIKSCQYAEKLRQGVRIQDNNDYLIDVLIVSAIIEARSCERFAAIAPHLDDALSDFYHKLYQSEERHFLTYLNFARDFSKNDITSRIGFFLEMEKELILTPEARFRFHSGTPVV